MRIHLFQNQRFGIALGCCLALTVLTRPVRASGITGEVGFVSRYVWRGFDLLPDNGPGLQPSLTWTLGESGFSVNLWSNIPLKDRDLFDDELDLTLSYARTLSEGLAAEVGFIHYGWYFADNFSFGDNTSQEFYLSLGLSKIFLTPSVTVYYDIGNGDGLYVSTQIGHTLPITQKNPLTLSAALGYNNGQWLPQGSDTGFSDLQVSASMPFTAGPLTLTASVNYMHPLLDIVNPDDEFWFGLSITK